MVDGGAEGLKGSPQASVEKTLGLFQIGDYFRSGPSTLLQTVSIVFLLQESRQKEL